MRLPEEDFIWVQRDGTGIRVGDMRTSHIRYSIQMMERNHPARLLSRLVKYKSLCKVLNHREEQLITKIFKSLGD